MTQQTRLSYQQERERYLATIVEGLSHDERFVAGWLTGSYGREQVDDVSDIDLTLVVADDFSDALCARERMMTAATTDERLALFSQFGQVAIMHENNHNAPEGGTFTFTVFAPAAIMVDWVLVPQSKARRPADSRLLFDHVSIPIATQPIVEVPPLDKVALAENIAFFWMMAAVTAKYLVRGDGVFGSSRLEELTRRKQEIDRQLAERPWRYLHGSQTVFRPKLDDQAAALLEICRAMAQALPEMAELGENDPKKAVEVIEELLALR